MCFAQGRAAIKQKPITPLLAAHHEAGHAVAATVFGYEIVAVRLGASRCRAGLGNVGEVEYAKPFLDYENDPNARVVCFSGLAAEWHYDAAAARVADASRDLDHIMDAVVRRYGGDALKHFARAQRRAELLIDRHWAAVTRVARQLMVHDLSGSDVARIFRAVKAGR